MWLLRRGARAASVPQASPTMTQRSSKRHGSRRHSHRERSGEPLEFLKPLVVLGLMGMILYGAYSVISRGPGRESGDALGPLQPTISLDLPSSLDSSPNAVVSDVPAGNQLVASSPPQGGPPVVTGPVGTQPSASPPVSVGANPTPVARTIDSLAPDLASQSPEATLPDDMPLPPAALRGQAAAPPVPGSPGTTETTRQPVGATFAAAWTNAHEKLAAGQYAEALSILSAWQDDPGLADAETRRLEELLGQLAGSVIYSQENHLGPAHLVSQGETLEAIASPLHVPWQLLAKINGVSDSSALVTGESLKVVEGPFDAIISLSRRRLSLQLRGRYAGSFPISIGRQVEEKVGQSLAVERIHRGTAGEPGSPAELASGGPVVQAAFHAGGVGRQILLRDGVVIEAVADPADAPTGPTSVVVSAPDLGELVDILVPGSQVFLRP